MKLQNIDYENMIVIYHICRYIMLPLFTSYRKSEICFKYLRMLSRMKAAYIFYFQFNIGPTCIDQNFIENNEKPYYKEKYFGSKFVCNTQVLKMYCFLKMTPKIFLILH